MKIGEKVEVEDKTKEEIVDKRKDEDTIESLKSAPDNRWKSILSINMFAFC